MATGIYDWYDLDDIREDLAGEYILMNNLDENSPGYSGIGNNWTPIGDYSNPFTGSFDGNNKTISGLYINRPSQNEVGLFGCIGSGAEIKNLGLIGGSIRGAYSTGGIVGYLRGGNIYNCYNTASIYGDYFIGGIAGVNAGGNIYKCYNTGNVVGNAVIGGMVGYNDGNIYICYNTGSVNGSNNYLGGITGYSGGNVYNCYNTGSVSGNAFIGGILGVSNNEVYNCYNAGSISGDTLIGGVVGSNWGNLSNSYNTGNVSGTIDVGGFAGEDWGDVSNCYFSAGPDNGIGTYEPDATSFYSNSHAVYRYGQPDGWTSPPWYWWSNDYPKFKPQGWSHNLAGIQNQYINRIAGISKTEIAKVGGV